MKKLIILTFVLFFESCNSQSNYVDRTSSRQDIEYYKLTEHTANDDNGTKISIYVPQGFYESVLGPNQLASFNYIKNGEGYYISIDKLESRNTIKVDSKRYIDIINNQFKTQYNGDIKKFENILPKSVFKNLNLIAFEGNIVINNKYFAKRLAEYVDARNNGTELQDVPLIEFHYITHHNKRKYTISIIRYGYNSYSDMVGLASTIGGSVKFR